MSALALYEIMTRVTPYHELSKEKIDARYSNADFPETESLESIGAIDGLRVRVYIFLNFQILFFDFKHKHKRLPS
jgi:hypothetical protein